tara:strand:- start:19 stop:639 length:621 start_codon:yes stop_codon:yes gene_type:complete
MVIYHDDIIQTGEKGRMQVLLLDQTVFTLGPDTRLILDEFVYDPTQKNANEVSTRLMKGAFRFVTGKIALKKPSRMKVKIPGSGSVIGIRGTDFIVSYDEETKKSSLQLHEGEVDIANNEEYKIISAGNTVVFDEEKILPEEKLVEEEWEAVINDLEVEEEPIISPSAVFQIRIGIFVFLFVIIILSVRKIIKRRKKGKEHHHKKE